MARAAFGATRAEHYGGEPFSPLHTANLYPPAGQQEESGKGIKRRRDRYVFSLSLCLIPSCDRRDASGGRGFAPDPTGGNELIRAVLALTPSGRLRRPIPLSCGIVPQTPLGFSSRLIAIWYKPSQQQSVFLHWPFS